MKSPAQPREALLLASRRCVRRGVCRAILATTTAAVAAATVFAALENALHALAQHLRGLQQRHAVFPTGGDLHHLLPAQRLDDLGQMLALRGAVAQLATIVKRTVTPSILENSSSHTLQHGSTGHGEKKVEGPVTYFELKREPKGLQK